MLSPTPRSASSSWSNWGKKQTRYVLAVVPGDARLDLAAVKALLDGGELYFNAGRLDRSVALASEDYVRLAQPRIARIAAT